LKPGWKLAFLLLLAGPVLADVQPISLTFFGLYGSPVQPLGLASSTTDILGFNVLGEWNPSNYASLGLGFEQANFYTGPGFNFQTVNLEGRFFPLQNGKDKFSPYLYGGAGLSLSSDGSPQLKAGLGSRVSFMGPVYLDLAVGSHWIQAPGNFQYVDVRAGLSYSIEFNPQPAAKATPSPTALPATPVATAAPAKAASLPTPLPTPAATASETVIPTAAPVVHQAPVTTLAQGKKYFKLGVKAYGKKDYKSSFKYFKRSLELKTKRKHAPYYAQAYANIGKLYQFHASTVKNHLQKALDNYQNALNIDPKNKDARRYFKKLRLKVARLAKAQSQPTPATAVDTPALGAPSPPLPAKTPAPSASSDSITIN